MTTYLDLIAESKFFDIFSFALVFSYVIPFLLRLVPDSLRSSTPRKRKGIPLALEKKIKKEVEPPTPKSVHFHTFCLYFGIICQIVLAVIIKFKKPTFWLFYYDIASLFRVLAIILVILFEIVYIWSLLLLEPSLRTLEGRKAPPKIIQSGPYSEVWVAFVLFPSYMSFLCRSVIQFSLPAVLWQ